MRAPGWYWVKLGGKWITEEWTGGNWGKECGTWRQDHDFLEIDERPIERLP